MMLACSIRHEVQLLRTDLHIETSRKPAWIGSGCNTASPSPKCCICLALPGCSTALRESSISCFWVQGPGDSTCTASQPACAGPHRGINTRGAPCQSASNRLLLPPCTPPPLQLCNAAQAATHVQPTSCIHHLRHKGGQLGVTQQVLHASHQASAPAVPTPAAIQNPGDIRACRLSTGSASSIEAHITAGKESMPAGAQRGQDVCAGAAQAPCPSAAADLSG